VFIFKEILCCWGALEEIVTDSSPAFIEALNWLAEQYGIHHIYISPYNSQANGIVECHYLDVDNLNTTQAPEYTKDKYNVKIMKRKVSPKVSPTTYIGQRVKGRRSKRGEEIITK
jgi:hypothetical protein